MCNVVLSSRNTPDSSLWFKTIQNLITSQSKVSISDGLFGRVFIYPLQENNILDNLHQYIDSIKNISQGVPPSKRNEKDLLKCIAAEFQDNENNNKYTKSRKFKREVVIHNLSTNERLKKAELYFDTIVDQYAKDSQKIAQKISKRLEDKYKKILLPETTPVGKYILTFMIYEAINMDPVMEDAKIPPCITDYIGDISHPYIKVSIEDISLVNLYALAFSNPCITLEAFVQLIIDVDKICDDYKISLNSWMPGFTNIVSNNIELLLNKLDLCQFNRLFEFFETIKTSSLKKELINSFGSQILLSAEKVWKTEDLIIDDVTAKLINNINKFKKDLLAYSLDSKQFTGLH